MRHRHRGPFWLAILTSIGAFILLRVLGIIMFAITGPVDTGIGKQQ